MQRTTKKTHFKTKETSKKGSENEKMDEGDWGYKRKVTTIKRRIESRQDIIGQKKPKKT